MDRIAMDIPPRIGMELRFRTLPPNTWISEGSGPGHWPARHLASPRKYDKHRKKV